MAGPPRTLTPAVAHALAGWATELDPSEEDLALARRSLLDTAAVMVAAREDPVAPLFGRLSEAGRWSALAHVLDYDDLHMPSTTHISAVCVPVALAASGAGGPDPARAAGGPDPARAAGGPDPARAAGGPDPARTAGGPDPARAVPGPARAYLAGAGVMARLGTALGWRHYSAGWHATCTAGAPAAAVTAAVARGLDASRTAIAIALAIPAAGGMRRAFGTAAKSLQVGFAAEAGMRAATLAADGASADVRVVEDWMALVGGDPGGLAEFDATPAVPHGLALKLYPCCYALQRPISAAAQLPPVAADRVRRITVRTPACSLAPLIHPRPRTGLEGKFSLEYGIATALLDGRPGIESFSDEAVARPEAVRLTEVVEVVPGEGGDQLLAGEIELEIELDDGTDMRAELALPPGAPDRPPSDQELRAKLEVCAGSEADRLAALSWDGATAYLRSRLAD